MIKLTTKVNQEWLNNYSDVWTLDHKNTAYLHTADKDYSSEATVTLSPAKISKGYAGASSVKIAGKGLSNI